MKRNVNEQPEVLNLSRLEIPYLFGTLMLIPDADEAGFYKVCDKERNYCFGTICLTGEHNFQTELNSTIDTATNKMKSKHREQAIEKSDDSTPCTSRQANERRSESATKRSIDDLESEQDTDSKESKKKLKSIASSTDLVNMPRMSISKLLWGVLNFYSNKKLIYTHYLWGTEPITVNADSLQNVRKFYLGKEQIESLADDFRYVLGKGFTLRKREGLFSKIEFKRSDEDTKTQYKIINSKKEFEITNSELVLIYDGSKAIENLNEKVSNFEEGYRFVDSLYLLIVLNNSFLTRMGITMERITRKSAELMPYYLVLKLNNEFDCLNSHLFSKLNIN